MVPGPRLPERYELLRHVADGGMASVWEARDTLLGRVVALKVLRAGDQPARERFAREARAAARLSSHPHVVTVHDVGEHEGTAFLVMAYYPEGSVSERLKQGPVAQDEALDWLEDAASALDAAHAEGIVHRDVKPANLLLDGHGGVAVGDFGIAQAAWESSMTQTGMVLGTFAYLSPEQRAGQPATAASDRFALGLVAGRLLTGVRPGSEQKGQPLPPAAAAALRRATAPDPADRPASCTELVAGLDAGLAEGWGDDDTMPASLAAPPPGRPRMRTSEPEPERVRAPAVPLPGAAEAAHTAATPARGGEEPARPPATQHPDEPARTAATQAARGPRPPARGPGAPPPGAPGGDRRRTALIAAAAAAVLALGVLAAILLGGGGSGDDPATQASTKTRTRTQSTRSTASSSIPSSSTGSTATPSTTDATGTTGAGSGSASSHAQLIALNSRGQALSSDAPRDAVPLLRQAVDGLCADTSDVNCLYALYNLAVAQRLAGDPAGAITTLRRRQGIDATNQPGAVDAELARDEQALQEQQARDSGDDGFTGASAGAVTPAAPPAAGPGKGSGKADGKGKGPKEAKGLR